MPYEVPENPDLVLKTAECTVEECVDQLATFLQEMVRKITSAGWERLHNLPHSLSSLGNHSLLFLWCCGVVCSSQWGRGEEGRSWDTTKTKHHKAGLSVATGTYTRIPHNLSLISCWWTKAERAKIISYMTVPVNTQLYMWPSTAKPTT